MNSLLILFNQLVELYVWVLIINAIASWLVAFNVINTSNRFVYLVLETTYKLTEPPLRFIRRYIPNLGSIDISPVILILGLIFLRNFINEIFYKAAF
ncbi:YggT family protein [Pelagibacteraceae bacterium]|jgi:YggT family protein|nr:YggT family protein [Pelagibacteraceae bacterium]|tara:strand:+ start:696 stop:986 length:291 start_codon:yes stop_codon:yes gene_type:complete